MEAHGLVQRPRRQHADDVAHTLHQQFGDGLCRAELFRVMAETVEVMAEPVQGQRAVGP